MSRSLFAQSLHQQVRPSLEAFVEAPGVASRVPANVEVEGSLRLHFSNLPPFPLYTRLHCLYLLVIAWAPLDSRWGEGRGWALTTEPRARGATHLVTGPLQKELYQAMGPDSFLNSLKCVAPTSSSHSNPSRNPGWRLQEGGVAFYSGVEPHSNSGPVGPKGNDKGVCPLWEWLSSAAHSV